MQCKWILIFTGLLLIMSAQSEEAPIHFNLYSEYYLTTQKSIAMQNYTISTCNSLLTIVVGLMAIADKPLMPD